jgi:hypothetical protein
MQRLAKGWTAVGSEFESQYEQDFFSSSRSPDVWCSPRLLLKEYPVVKRQGLEAHHSPTSDEVNNTWIYTPTPQYVFIQGLYLFIFLFYLQLRWKRCIKYVSGTVGLNTERSLRFPPIHLPPFSRP